MADNQAKITLGVDGASEARRAAQDVETAWSKSARGISSAWQGVGRALAGTVASAVQDIGRVALAAEAIDFAGAVKSAIDLQGAIERMSLASGRDTGQIKRQFAEIGNKIGEQPQHVAAWQRSLNRTLYDFDKATKATDLLGRTAFEVGRSFDEMAGFGDVLGRSSKDADELARSLGNVRSQVALLGKDRGASLVDNAQKVAGGVAGKFAPGAVKSKGGLVGEASAIQTALIEQGLPPEQAAEAASKLISDVAADPRGHERSFGMKHGTLTDQYGRITKSPIEILKLQQAAISKMSGGNKAYGRYIASNVLGPIAGGAATGLDLDRVQALANLDGAPGPSENPLAGAPTLSSEAEIARRGREAVDPLLPYVQQARAAFASHPVVGAIGSSLISGAAGYGLKALFTGGGAAASGSAAVGGALGAATTAAGVETGVGMTLAQITAGETAGGLLTGAGIGTGLGIGGVVGAGALGAGAVLYDIGQDTDSTGADYRRANADILADSQVKAIGAAADASGGDPIAFLRGLSPGLRTDIEGNPSLQAIAQGAVTGEPVNAESLEAAFVSALGRTKLSITLVNQTGTPIGAVTADKANADVRQ